MDFYVNDSNIITLTEFYIRDAREREERRTLQGLADSLCIRVGALKDGDGTVLETAKTMIEAELERELTKDHCELAMDELVKDFGWKR